MAVLVKSASVRANTGYARRMSSHLAANLILFCMLQIGIVARMGGSLILHLALIIAIGAFAVAARGLERRWEWLDQSSLSSASLAARFRRDVAQVWLVSIGSGLMWIPATIIFRFLFG